MYISGRGGCMTVQRISYEYTLLNHCLTSVSCFWLQTARSNKGYPCSPVSRPASARPTLSVVKIILIYNSGHYKHVRKQHHGDAAQTQSQSRTVFIRCAWLEKVLTIVYIHSMYRCAPLLTWLTVHARKKGLDCPVHIC